MKLESALRSNSGKMVFAAIWAGILASSWGRIVAGAQFQVLESNGKQLEWALALLYKTALYFAILTLPLWIGLAIYLAATRQFKLQNLARGLFVMLFVLFVVLGIESFIRAEHFSRIGDYVLRWIPFFASLFAGCRLAVPRKPGEVFSRAAAKP